jgi:hypothetical protein
MAGGGPAMPRRAAAAAVCGAPVWNLSLAVYGYRGWRAADGARVAWRWERAVRVIIAPTAPAVELLGLLRSALGDAAGLAIDGVALGGGEAARRTENWARLIPDLGGVEALEECLLLPAPPRPAVARGGAPALFGDGGGRPLPPAAGRTVADLGLADDRALQVRPSRQTRARGRALTSGATAQVRRVSHLLVLAGGRDAHGAATAAVTALDTQRLEWLQLPPMLSPRAQPTASIFADGSILVAGGNDGSATLRTAERFDPREGRWRAEPEMPVVRDGPAALLAARIQERYGGGLPGGGEGGGGAALNEGGTMARAFAGFDTDGDGTISVDEFRRAWRELMPGEDAGDGAGDGAGEQEAGQPTGDALQPPEQQAQLVAPNTAESEAQAEVGAETAGAGVRAADAGAEGVDDVRVGRGGVGARSEAALTELLEAVDGDHSESIDYAEFVAAFAGEGREAAASCTLDGGRSTALVGGRAARGYPLGTVVLFDTAAAAAGGGRPYCWRPGGREVPAMVLPRCGFGACALLADGPPLLLAVGGVGPEQSQTAELCQLRAGRIGGRMPPCKKSNRWELAKRAWDYKHACEAVVDLEEAEAQPAAGVEAEAEAEAEPEPEPELEPEPEPEAELEAEPEAEADADAEAEADAQSSASGQTVASSASSAGGSRFEACAEFSGPRDGWVFGARTAAAAVAEAGLAEHEVDGLDHLVGYWCGSPRAAGPFVCAPVFQ